MATPSASSEQKPSNGGYRKLKIPWGLVFAIGIGVLVLVNLIQAKMNAVKPLPEGLIQANGRIEGDHVIVSSKFSGRIETLNAREGSTVAAGDLLIRVGDPQLEARKVQAEGTLAAAIAQAQGSANSVDLTRQTGSAVIQQAAGMVDQASSAIGSAHADLTRIQAQIDASHASEKVADLSITQAQSDLVTAQANRARAEAGVSAAKSGLASAKASLSAARASVDSARATANQADREAARYTKLENEGAVSAEVAERANTAASQAKSALAASQHQAEAAQSVVDARFSDVQAAQKEVEVADSAIQQAQARVSAAKQQRVAASSATKQVEAQRSGYQHGVQESEARHKQALGQFQQAMTAPKQVQVSQNNRTSAEARTKEARGALDEITSMIVDMSVKSPIGGTVITRFQSQGELVSAGSPILELVDLDHLYLKVYVPEQMIGKVRLGLPAKIYTDAYPNEPFDAKVGYIASEAEFTPKEIQTSAERVSLVYAVRLYLTANPGHRLTPGLPADAIIRWKDETPWQKPQ